MFFTRSLSAISLDFTTVHFLTLLPRIFATIPRQFNRFNEFQTEHSHCSSLCVCVCCALCYPPRLLFGILLVAILSAMPFVVWIFHCYCFCNIYICLAMTFNCYKCGTIICSWYGIKVLFLVIVVFGFCVELRLHLLHRGTVEHLILLVGCLHIACLWRLNIAFVHGNWRRLLDGRNKICVCIAI